MKQNRICNSFETNPNGFEFQKENTTLMQANFTKYKSNLEHSIRSNQSARLANPQVGEEGSIHQRSNKIYPIL
jgi:hypothetical protein